ncbi:MAG: nickel transporter permease [Chloroflexi bacterium]|nr:nickel transporter permease [Chloroflexota bacterium]
MSQIATTPVQTQVARIRSPFAFRLRRGKGRGKLYVGTLIVGAIAVLAIFSRVIAPFDPITQDLTSQFLPPSHAHLFGTDQFGRDVFSRAVYAASLDLQIAFLGTLFCMLLGVSIGVVAGYFGGIVDLIAGRLIDVVTAIPGIVAIIALIAALGSSMLNLYIALAVTGWTAYARLARGEVIAAKNLQYVQASRALGYTNRRIVLRHILPNVITPPLLFWITDMVGTVLLVTALSYLGLGPQPPTPEWGAMISEAQPFMLMAWWVPLFPGLGIVIAGIGLGLLGDGLADFLRPEVG